MILDRSSQLNIVSKGYELYIRVREQKKPNNIQHTPAQLLSYTIDVYTFSLRVCTFPFFFFYLTEQNFVFVMSFVGASERASEWEGRREGGREGTSAAYRPPGDNKTNGKSRLFFVFSFIFAAVRAEI